MPRGPTARPRYARGGEPSRRPEAIARLALGPVALVAFAACSILVNHASSQCSTDADCAKFPGKSCVQGGCVDGTVVPEGGLLDISVASPTNPPCTSTQDCLAENGGTNWICRRPDQVCVQLTSEDCPLVGGDYTGDDALILGAIFPLYGPHATTGAMLRNAVQLALNDFIGGLPSPIDGGLPRHIAVVFCDESQNPTRAATHLQQDLQLPAILGTGESATTLTVVNGVTLAAGQFLMAPRATVNLSAYQSHDTVWRTCTSDAVEGAALTMLAESVVGRVAGAGDGGAPVALTILHASDAESTQLDATISGSLVLNGAAATAPSNSSLFLDVSYGDPDTDPNPDADYAQAITQLTTATTLPNVVVLTGSTQAVHGLLGGLESAWPAGAARPMYVLSSGLQTTELLGLVAGDSSLLTRIVGTAPGENDATYKNLASFLALYGETFSDGGAPITFGVAQTYDAFYTLAYAAAIARNTDLDGRDVAGALIARLGSADGASPTPIAVGPSGISGGLAAIAAGQRITLEGASAPLAFDVTSGNLATDIQVWCVVAGQGSPAFVHSGEYYSTGTAQLQGTFANGCSD